MSWENSPAEGTGAALVHHWDWAAKKGLMNPNTARSLRAASSQVLGVLEGGDSLDVRSLDVEDTLNRFVNLRKKDFVPQSLEAYKQRFRNAVSLYLSYLDDPAGWRPALRERSAPSEKRRPAKEGSARSEPEELVGDRGGVMITYPFPLRAGQVARLTLPPDLTMAEVRRLTAYMSLLAIDSEQSAK
jgi:hypothetical protein